MRWNFHTDEIESASCGLVHKNHVPLTITTESGTQITITLCDCEGKQLVAVSSPQTPDIIHVVKL